MPVLYPPASYKGDGTRYGTIPRDDLPLCLVFHTTETAGLPGYKSGSIAPHLTYLPTTRTWIQHQSLDAHVGALVGKSRAGVETNGKALQVEVVCYSDKVLADQKASRLWVGDLTDQHYADLGALAAFCIERGWVTATVYQPWDTWVYGVTSPLRMLAGQWLGFNGITGHGAVPGNSHWDPGVMDLRRIARQAKEDDVFYLASDVGDAYDRRVEYWQRQLVRAGADLTPDGIHGAATADAIKAIAGGTATGVGVGPGEADRIEAVVRAKELEAAVAEVAGVSPDDITRLHNRIDTEKRRTAGHVHRTLAAVFPSDEPTDE